MTIPIYSDFSELAKIRTDNSVLQKIEKTKKEKIQKIRNVILNMEYRVKMKLKINETDKYICYLFVPTVEYRNTNNTWIQINFDFEDMGGMIEK